MVEDPRVTLWPRSARLDRFATAWAIYQGLLLEAIPFLLGVDRRPRLRC